VEIRESGEVKRRGMEKVGEEVFRSGKRGEETGGGEGRLGKVGL